MLDPELVGRSPVERTELRYRTDVCLLGARRQIAHRHVVDHALAQRRDRLGHRWAPVGWAARTRNPRRQDASYDAPTPIGAANGPKGIYGRRSLNHQNPPFSILATDLTTGDYRGSGLVQRDVMECPAANVRSLRLDVGRPDDLGPHLDLRRDAGRELLPPPFDQIVAER